MFFKQDSDKHSTYHYLISDTVGANVMAWANCVISCFIETKWSQAPTQWTPSLEPEYY